MLRRSLFASALMLAGVVGFASSAKAATQSVSFSGQVNTTCTFTAPSSGSFEGTLAPADTTNKKLITSTPARVGIQCPGGNLSIGTPVSSGNNPTSTTNTTRITTVKSRSVNSGETAITLATDNTENGDAAVIMEATPSTATATLAPGSYNYTVVVTATPGATSGGGTGGTGVNVPIPSLP
ncbi:MAG: hypothetical protein KME22_23925 [Hassallia sp. WJT32-NPBG1]|nr:hypothetical protein [Hassallia sp. WJT32-NPBG1]